MISNTPPQQESLEYLLQLALSLYTIVALTPYKCYSHFAPGLLEMSALAQDDDEPPMLVVASSEATVAEQSDAPQAKVPITIVTGMQIGRDIN